MQKILIMGLPGAGKTTIADAVRDRTNALHINADEIRAGLNKDLGFSLEDRIENARRLGELARLLEQKQDKPVLVDFVCPTKETRQAFGDADVVVWVDTIDKSRFEDTNKAFIAPEVYDFRITEQNAEKWAEFIADHIVDNRRRPRFNWQLPTVQMLGRWQPWHDGHRALFERAIAKTGQVVIQIRDCQGWQGTNPFEIEKVKSFIRRDLDSLYQGQYELQVVPNIVNITYGRDVGYTIEQETFDDSITSISATKIRKDLGIA